MPLTVAHSTVVAVPDDGSSPIGSDEWNAAHTVTGTIDLATDIPSGPAASVLWSDGATAQWDTTPSVLQIGVGSTGSPTHLVDILGAGTATVAPLRLASGVNLTTPAAGAFEYDGNELFFSPAASDRRVLTCEAFIRQHATYTLTSSTAVQKLFNGSANGALTLPVGTYWFECAASLSAMSATSGNAAFSIANGTGTAANFLFNWAAVDDTTGIAGAWAAGMAISSATPAAMATATVNTTLQFVARGTFEVSGAGTFIPSIQLANAAAAVVAIGSFFRCHRLGAATDIVLGNWS